MNWSFYGSLAHLPLGVAVTVEFLGPLVLTTVLSRRLLDFVAVAAAGAGVLLISEALTVPLDELSWIGLLLAATAGVLWAAYILLSGRTGAEFPKLDGLALALVVSTIVVLPAGLASSDLWTREHVRQGPRAGGALLAAAVLPRAARPAPAGGQRLRDPALPRAGGGGGGGVRGPRPDPAPRCRWSAWCSWWSPARSSWAYDDPRNRARSSRPEAEGHGLCGLCHALPMTELADPTFLDDRLAHWAEANPDGEAFTYLGRTWTWAQWEERVRRLAGALQGEGDRPRRRGLVPRQEPPGLRRADHGGRQHRRRQRDHQLPPGRRRDRLRRQRLRRQAAARRHRADAADRARSATG